MRGNEIKVLVRNPVKPLFSKWSEKIKFFCKSESNKYTQCILKSASEDLNKDDCLKEYNLLYQCIKK